MKEKKGEEWGCESSEGEEAETRVPGGFADKIRLITHTTDGGSHKGYLQPAAIFPRLLRSWTGIYEGQYNLGLHPSLADTWRSLSQSRWICFISTSFNFFFGSDRLGFSSSLLYRSSRSELARNSSIFV